MSDKLFIATNQLHAGDNTDYVPIANSFDVAVADANQMIEDDEADDDVVYVYELVLVARVKPGKPVVEKVK